MPQGELLGSCALETIAPNRTCAREIDRKVTEKSVFIQRTAKCYENLAGEKAKTASQTRKKLISQPTEFAVRSLLWRQISALLCLNDHFFPITPQEPRIFEAIQHIRPVRALQVQHCSNHFFLIPSRFGQWHSRGLSYKGHAAGALLPVR